MIMEQEMLYFVDSTYTQTKFGEGKNFKKYLSLNIFGK